MKKPVHLMTKDEYESHIEYEKQSKEPFSFIEVVLIIMFFGFFGLVLASVPVAIMLSFGKISEIIGKFMLIVGISTGILFAIAHPIYFWKYKKRPEWILN